MYRTLGSHKLFCAKTNSITGEVSHKLFYANVSLFGFTKTFLRSVLRHAAGGSVRAVDHLTLELVVFEIVSSGRISPAILQSLVWMTCLNFEEPKFQHAFL